MKVGIRTKLVVLLVAVALLPLLAALLTIVIGTGRLRNEIFGKGILSLVTSESRVMRFELIKDVELLKIALHGRLVLGGLGKVQQKRSSQELARLDKHWPLLPANKGPVREALDNPTADVLRSIMRENTVLVELLVTDRFGQLVAATGRTSDFYQGDESWWLQCYNQGRGQVYIPRVNYDRSAKVWGVDLCIPIMVKGKVLGVTKVVMDISRWLPDCNLDFGSGRATMKVVGDKGFILHSQDILAGRAKPMTERIGDWRHIIASPPGGAWRTTDDDKIQAYAPVRMPESIGQIPVKMSHWTLVADIDKASVQYGLVRLSILILLIGIICIGLLFSGGVLLIDRSLINRIRKIGQSARRVSHGDLQHRADSSWAGTRAFGMDEIDDLAHDFNNMVRKLQKSHTELTEANRLKEDFIRIAGHELRTPVSYIVGMATLMKTCQDAERLNKAIDTMGFKAGRLDEIIQAMFKLIPAQSLANDMNYQDVNVSKLLEEVYTDAKPWIERRNQRLIIEPGQRDTIIQADKNKLRDAIENVVMNAIKFTPNAGQVKVSVHRRLGGYVAIQIADEGPGIPESDRPHIFDPFYSGSDILKHSTGKSGYGKRGMGLGLAIVKHFVDMHGGTVEFTTGPNGTTVTIQLPIERPAENGE